VEPVGELVGDPEQLGNELVLGQSTGAGHRISLD
jgi:hypothetical protein